ncbi:MAG: YfaZ family outer membrane protein [Campylobacterota bacterium]|nr:YfaZ family outer membrane protein [Campylobacterota bacterium]
MYIKKLFLTSLLSFGLLQAENSIGINISDEDLEVLAAINLNQYADYSDSTTYVIDGYYLRTDEDNLFGLGLSGENTLQGVQGLTLGFGAKFVFADDFTALPLLGKARYTLPFNDRIPTTSLGISFAYAPPVLTFSDGESYREFRMEADMEVIQNIHLFTGYRNIDTEYESYDTTFNESFYAGMKLSF